MIIIGESALKKGINDFIDTFLRDNEMRINVYLVAAEGEAAGIFKGQCGVSEIVSNGIAEFFNKYERQDNTYRLGCTVSNYCERMLYEYPAVTIPVIGLKEDAAQLNERKSENMKRPQIYISSYMVLNEQGQSFFTLTEEEELALCIWQNMLVNGLVSVEYDNALYNIMVHDSKVRLSYEEGGFELRVKAEGIVLAVGDDKIGRKQLDIISVTEALQDKLAAMLRQAFQKEKEYNCDFLALGEYLHRHHPSKLPQITDFPFGIVEPRIIVEIKPLSAGDLYYSL